MKVFRVYMDDAVYVVRADSKEEALLLLPRVPPRWGVESKQPTVDDLEELFTRGPVEQVANYDGMTNAED